MVLLKGLHDCVDLLLFSVIPLTTGLYSVCTVMNSKYVTVTQSQQVVVYYTTGTLCWDLWEVFYCDKTELVTSR